MRHKMKIVQFNRIYSKSHRSGSWQILSPYLYHPEDSSDLKGWKGSNKTAVWLTNITESFCKQSPRQGKKKEKKKDQQRTSGRGKTVRLYCRLCNLSSIFEQVIFPACQLPSLCNKANGTYCALQNILHWKYTVLYPIAKHSISKKITDANTKYFTNYYSFYNYLITVFHRNFASNKLNSSLLTAVLFPVA